MPDLDPFAVDAACQELFQLPGVHMAGAGFRWRDGRATDEAVVVAYVWHKQSLAEMSPLDRIPRRIAGIPIDVMEAGAPTRTELPEPPRKEDPSQPSPSVMPWKDENEYPQLRGGIRCEAAEAGTICCIGTSTLDATRGKVVALVNHHVVSHSVEDAKGAVVYHPMNSSCCSGSPIGSVLASVRTTTRKAVEDDLAKDPNRVSVDAAVVLIKDDLVCFGEQQIGYKPGTAIQIITGVVPTEEIYNGMPVKKRGARLGPVDGTIDHVKINRKPQKGDPPRKECFLNQMVIEPIVEDRSKDGIHYFQIGGDSGAAVTTREGDRLVGMVWSAYPKYPRPGLTIVCGVATDINVVLEAMHVAIPPTTAPGQVLVNRKAAGAAPSGARAIGGAPVWPAATRTLLQKASRDIEQTAHGRVYVGIIRRHQAEVRALVRSNRRVGAIWKRYGGQVILQAALDAIAGPDTRIPTAVGGRPLSHCAGRIAEVLRRYGSAALAAETVAYQEMVARLPGTTYNQLLAQLRAGEPVLG